MLHRKMMEISASYRRHQMKLKLGTELRLLRSSHCELRLMNAVYLGAMA